MKQINTKKYRNEIILFIVFISVFILMSAISPSTFLTVYNMQSMAYQMPEFGIMTFAMMVVIITGGINLSVTATSALSAIIGGLVLSTLHSNGIGSFWVIAVSLIGFLIAAAACGALNGFVVAYVGVTPFLVTLATMTLFGGISVKITKGGAISGFPESFFFFGNGDVFGIPFPVIIYSLIILVTWILLNKSPFGLRAFMLGCNPKATLYSGVDTKKLLLKLYIYSGLLCGISAVIMASRYNSAKDTYGSSYLLQSVAASVLGGTDIAGGYGSVLGVVIAVAIIQVIYSGLNIAGLNPYLTNVVIGLILIFVLAINYLNSLRNRD